MAEKDRDDEGVRRGDRIPGKGFDAGGGYGGAGNASAYRGSSSYRRERDLDTSAFDRQPREPER